MTDFCTMLYKYAGLVGAELTEAQLSQFERYYVALTERNKVMNLTAITEPGEVAVKHFCDSICVLTESVIPDNASVIDVGSGAGFPGVPIKLCRPDIQLTALDGLNKRLDFLRELGAELGFDITLLHDRAESTGADKRHREKYDVAVSRAVARLNTLCEYCLPLVKVGGRFLAMKGPDAHDEIKEAQRAAELLGGRIAAVREYTLPDSSGRTIIEVEKVFRTPRDYPRHNSKIKTKPII